MNPNYAKKVKEEIDNLMKTGFITEVESSDWLFPIVVVPKKNGKLRVCVDYRKLNAQTIKDPFPLPFTDMMLDEIVGHEMYSFLDGYRPKRLDQPRCKIRLELPWPACALGRTFASLFNSCLVRRSCVALPVAIWQSGFKERYKFTRSHESLVQRFW
ncbi:hypothetical protein L7F22_003775 [Adiantum nelumboides]|nr:hypothetical protein [Adiantum nelumboides]